MDSRQTKLIAILAIAVAVVLVTEYVLLRAVG